MPRVGFACVVTQEKVSFEECLECSKDHERCDLTPPMIRGMFMDAPRSNGISVTTLGSCTRKVILQGKEPYWTSPLSDWFWFRGRLSHTLVEQHHADEDNGIIEKEFGVMVGDLPVIGHPDIVYPGNGLIVDYKSTTFVPKDGKHYGSHEAQLNCYRYLVMEGQLLADGVKLPDGVKLDCEIDRLQLAYFDMKRPKRVPVEVWPLERTENYIGERAQRLSECYKYDTLPEKVDCNVEEWECGYCNFSDACARYGSSLMVRIGRQAEA